MSRTYTSSPPKRHMACRGTANNHNNNMPLLCYRRIVKHLFYTSPVLVVRWRAASHTVALSGSVSRYTLHQYHLHCKLVPDATRKRFKYKWVPYYAFQCFSIKSQGRYSHLYHETLSSQLCLCFACFTVE
jgi:hypothetical protein